MTTMRGCLWRHPIKEFLITVSGHPHHCRIVKVLHYNNAGVLHLFSAVLTFLTQKGYMYLVKALTFLMQKCYMYLVQVLTFNAEAVHLFSASSDI